MTALVTIPPSESAGELVAAADGRLILVRSIMIAPLNGAAAILARLKSGSTVISPWFRAAATGTFQFESELGQLLTARGEALVLENASAADSAVVLLSYELRD